MIHLNSVLLGAILLLTLPSLLDGFHIPMQRSFVTQVPRTKSVWTSSSSQSTTTKTSSTKNTGLWSRNYYMVSSALDEQDSLPLIAEPSSPLHSHSTRSSATGSSTSRRHAKHPAAATSAFSNTIHIANIRKRKEPLVAIIGRPNVGKSALVNRISGIPQQHGGSIVANEAGITRDRTYKPAEFLGEAFAVVDTGGLVFDENSEEGRQHLFAKEIRDQAMIAIQESSAVILVVDAQTGLTNLDRAIGDFLRKQVLRHMPVHVAVNKCENCGSGGGTDELPAAVAAEFWNLGLGEPMPVSALHGVGTAELLERVFESIVERQTARPGFGLKVPELLAAKAAMKSKVPLPGEDALDFRLRKKYGIGDVAQQVLERYEAAVSAFDDDNKNRPEEINVAIIGRPNVGKSSLLNAIFGEPRAIVSDVAGTTRDTIDAIIERPASTSTTKSSTTNDDDFEEEGDNVDGDETSKKMALPTIYRFVDTAGIRRKNKVEYGPELFMVNRALRAMRRSDVALLILDATAGVTEQDRSLAEKIANDGRACVIICNKWDAVVNKDSSTYDKSVKYVRNELPQVSWAPILFLSAATGQRVNKIYAAVDEAVRAHRRRINTSLLNEVLRDAVLWQSPPVRRSGAQAKIYYAHQVSVRPPSIVVFCNDPELIGDNYRRYLDRKVRENLPGFEATPIRWMFRGRREREMIRNQNQQRGSMNGDPGDGGRGTSFPFPHAG